MHETRGIVKIISSSKKFVRHASKARRAANACLLFLFSPTIKNAEISVFLIKDEEMRAINKRFRGKDKVTNVLSFEEPKGFPRPDAKGKKCLGEVYLAPRYIEKRGERIEELVIHGILHLAGYTHDKTRDRMEMEKKENEILAYVTQCQKSSPVSTSAHPK